MVRTNKRLSTFGFTLVELLVVIGIIVILAALLLPALAGVKTKGRAVACLANLRQMSLGWSLYDDDANDRLPYNLGQSEIKAGVEQNRFLSWTSSIMSWELDPDNTNSVLLTQGGIGDYVAHSAKLYRCPTDWVVSDIQAAVGWRARVRSVSMNAMVGNPGSFTKDGRNINNPDYQQFFKFSQIPNPSQIFVFIEEHPDSINDGYFVNHPDSSIWTDLPAAYHNGAANLTFADGHAETHRWRYRSTRPPALPGAAHLPFAVPATDSADFEWLMERTSIDAPAGSSMP